MESLPRSVTHYKSTPRFSETSIPKGLLRAHKTKPGTWGKIVVLSGSLRYRILEPVREELVLSSGNDGIIAPEVLHEVEALGDVEFRVEFFH